MTTVAITGASGHVGHALALDLLGRGVRVRALGRDAGRLADLAARGAEIATGSADDPKFTSAAFRHADAVFVMIPPDFTAVDPTGRAAKIIDALAAGIQVARVRHAVALSSIGADQSEGNGPVAGLHRLEQRLGQVPGLHAVSLRAGYFMENFLATIPLIRGQGINGSAFSPDLPVTMIATGDIAAAAADLLAAPRFTGQSMRELQGPREYTFREATAILGAAIGKPDLSYVQFSFDDWRHALATAGFSPAVADGFVEMVQGFNTGHLRPRQPRTATTTTPTTLETFARTVFAPAFSR